MKDDKRSDDEEEPEEKAEEEPEEKAEEEPEEKAEEEPEEKADDDDVRTEAAVEQAEPAEPEKPLFAQGWPASAELDRLLAAFERGNYAYVRTEAPKVAEGAGDPQIKAAALDLRRRIDPAPLAGILVFVAIGLLVVLAGHYLGKHNPGAPPPTAPASTNAPLQPTNR